jgi:hypothetical protein
MQEKPKDSFPTGVLRKRPGNSVPWWGGCMSYTVTAWLMEEDSTSVKMMLDDSGDDRTPTMEHAILSLRDRAEDVMKRNRSTLAAIGRMKLPVELHDRSGRV